jgi:hypothetical protein
MNCVLKGYLKGMEKKPVDQMARMIFELNLESTPGALESQARRSLY